MAPVLEGDTDGPNEGGRVNESRVIVAGAMVGALVGAAVGYLFFTEGGLQARNRLEPAVDDLRREFARFQGTIEKIGAMAHGGIRAGNQFNPARAQSSYQSPRPSH